MKRRRAASFDKACVEHNVEHRQRNLGHITPIEALKNWQKTHPHLFKKTVKQAGRDIYKQTGLDRYSIAH